MGSITPEVQVQSLRDEDIAIIGMGCRLPGGIHSAEDLWNKLGESWDGWSEIPKTRFNPKGFHHPNPGKHGSFNSGGAYFLQEDIALFDAPFFNVTASEAHALDPQQRLLLECTYEALENAGIPSEALAGSMTGVFMGSSASDYAIHMLRDVQTTPMFHGTGCAESMLSNRISYTFDLKGPSVTSDTACSSGLSSLHLACQSLRAGDASQAIVGSCHLNVTPDSFVSLAKSRLLSPEGRSYAFDHRATSGYGRGEGVAIVILKPLRRALEDGDAIRSIIRASGMNQDGRTAGITMPNGQAQADLIRQVYTRSGLDPLHTGYVEAHGTGTAVGDPIEAQALASVFAPNRSASNPMYLGSLKSQIGHLEGASGIASIVKTVLTLEKGMFLPNANFEKPNPEIPLESWNFKVATSKEAWIASSGRVRTASVNSFGFGGSNVHVVLSEAAGQQNLPTNGISGQAKSLDVSKLYVLSAKSESSLLSYAERLSSYLDIEEKRTQSNIGASLAYTLGMRRSRFQWRLAVTASSLDDLNQKLGESPKVARSVNMPAVCFVFTGQGSQWFGMGRELIPAYPLFAASMKKADECLARMAAKWSLIEELFSKTEESSRLSEAELSQPACTAIQLSLTILLHSWGVKPEAVVGHSSGEIAAAFAAGNLSFEDAMSVAYLRGLASIKLKDRYPQMKGSMIAVGTSEENAENLVTDLKKGNANVACINSPVSVTVSGDEHAIEEVQARAEAEGLFNRKLHVDTAYHSHHMKLVAKEYTASIAAVQHFPSTVSFHSSLTGKEEDISSFDHSYWSDNLTHPVKFSQAMDSMYAAHTAKAERKDLFIIEIGPHAALEGPIKQTLDRNKDHPKFAYAPSLVRKQKASEQMQKLAADLFMAGQLLDLATINDPCNNEEGSVLTDLPVYSWTHTQKYWHASRIGQNHQFRSFGRNDILGTISDESSELEPVWRAVLDPDEVPWLRHHRVQGQTVFPIAGYLSMTVEAARQKAEMRGVSLHAKAEFHIREIVSSRAMVVEESMDTEIMTSLRPFNQSTKTSSDTWDEIRIFSWSAGRNWIEHFRALVSISKHQDSGSSLRRHDSAKAYYQQRATTLKEQCPTDVDWRGFIDMFSRIGIDFGPTFQNISGVKAGRNVAVTNVKISETATLMPLEHETPYIIHPTTLDMCCQGIFPAFTHGLASLRQTYMPTFIKSMVIRNGISTNPDDQFDGYFSTEGHMGGGGITGSGFVYDSAQSEFPAIRVEGLVLTPLSFGDIDSLNKEPNELCSQIIWEPAIDLWNQHRLANTLSTKNIPEDEKARVRVHEQGSFYYLQRAIDEIIPAEYDSFQPHHQKFYDWMRNQVEAAHTQGLPMQTADWLQADSGQREMFLAKLKSHDTAGLMICSMGEALPRILRTQIDPLSIMMHDDLLGQWYRNNISLEVGYAQTANLINKIAHQNPFLNIIEIGAGTGGITLPTLDTLGGYDDKKARFAKYTFTDISTGFFENAQKKFERWESLMTYARLDIEKDPVEQSFEAGTYDLVIAANVLHATKDMKNTLRNTAKLLKPGGKLVLVELTTQLLHHFMFATLPGWWLSEEPFRNTGPIMKSDRWNQLLKSAGFSGVSISAEDFPGEPEQSGSLMISTKLADNVGDTGDVVIVCDSEPKSLDLSNLQTQLESKLGYRSTVEPLMTAKLEGKWCLFIEELNRPLLANITAEEFEKIQNLTSAGSKGILWVVQDSWMESSTPNTSMILGLARTVRNETSCKLQVLDLDKTNPDAAATVTDVFVKTLASESSLQGEAELVERGGVVRIPRIFIDEKINKVLDRNMNQANPELQPLLQHNRPLKMRITSPGQLDSICFEDDKIARKALKDDEVEISVKATSLNFKDILIAVGQVPYEDPGLECAGLVVATGKDVSEVFPGDRVCACVNGSFANYVRCSASSVAKLADDISYAEGASIPAVYATAYYGLVELAQLCEGESVLIHAAAGGVGQAAITIAQRIRAKIFATVGSENKKLHLIDTFQIPESQIFYSRDTSFKDNIMRATNYQGVDVVLNSLAGDLLHASWETLAPFGRFIEIGKRDLQLNSRLEMDVLLRNTTFTAVDLGALREKKPTVFTRVFREVMELYRLKELKPVTPLNLFSFSDLQKTFRMMEGGKHMGKIVLEVREEDKVMATFPPNGGCKLRADVSYLITGGSGGLGRSISKWLVSQGAKNIVLASRSGLKNEKAQALVNELAAMGASLDVRSCDVTNQEAMNELVRECAPPIKGAIHGAMVLKDILFENSNFDHFKSIVEPKVLGAWNLHHALSDLDFFIMLGSVAGIVGNRGQAAYNSTSAFLNAFAQFRAKQDLPAICLDLGVVEDVGYIAENTETKVTLTDLYSDMMEGDKRLNVTEKKLHALIQAAINGDIGNGKSVLTGIRLRAGDVEQFWESDPKFSHLRRAVAMTESTGILKGKEVPVKELLKTAQTPGSIFKIFTDSIISKTSSIMMIPIEDISPSEAIAEYGLDSLVAVEIRNWMARDLGATIALLELLTSPSIESLAQNVARKSALVDQQLLLMKE